MPTAAPRIAIVDDDPSVLKALARLLSTRAFIAKTFQSGEKFLASLQDEVPDCLILDLQMPEMTGLELHLDLGRRGVQNSNNHNYCAQRNGNARAMRLCRHDRISSQAYQRCFFVCCN